MIYRFEKSCLRVQAMNSEQNSLPTLALDVGLHEDSLSDACKRLLEFSIVESLNFLAIHV